MPPRRGSEHIAKSWRRFAAGDAIVSKASAAANLRYISAVTDKPGFFAVIDAGGIILMRSDDHDLWNAGKHHDYLLGRMLEVGVHSLPLQEDQDRNALPLRF